MKVQKKIPKPRRAKAPEAQQRLDEYAKLMKRRGDWARRILLAQDAKTRQAIEELVDVISSMADQSGTATVITTNGAVVKLTVPQQVFNDGWLWVAMRLCRAAYEWDIQIANFHPIVKRKVT